MKPSHSPSALAMKRRSMGAKLQDIIDMPKSSEIEQEFLALLEAADTELKHRPPKDQSPRT